MTGPEHYAKAEEYAARAAKAATRQGADNMAHLAQAHATLALVAANVMAMGDRLDGSGTGHDPAHLDFYQAIQ